MAGFKNIKFPHEIAPGSAGSPTWKQFVFEKDSGGLEVVSLSSTFRMRYDLSGNPKLYENLAELKRFFAAVGGAEFGFRFEDPTDYTSNANGRSNPTYFDQVIGAADNATTQFQLKKTYQFSGQSHGRKVTKPQSGTVVAGVGGVQRFDFSVDHETGILTFTTAPVIGDVTAGFKYDVPAMLAPESQSFAWSSSTAGEVDLILIEMLEGTATTQDRYLGGHKNHGTITGDISISPSAGAVHIVEGADQNNRRVYLPDPATLSFTGNIIMTLLNESSFTLQVRAHDSGTTLKALAAGKAGFISLSKDSGGDYWWHIVDGNI